MPKEIDSSQKFWGWVVFLVTLVGHIPLFIGGWQHPIEINVAAYELWTALAIMFVYSSKD